MKRLALALFLQACVCAEVSGLSIESQVLGLDNHGLAGARVELRPVLRVYDQGLRDLEGKGEPDAVAVAVTESDGRFRFALSSEGPWRITVSAPGFPVMESGPRIVVGEETLEPVRVGGVTVDGVDSADSGDGGPRVWRPYPPPVSRSRIAGAHVWPLEVYETGKPVPGALVREMGSRLILGRTDRKGSLLLDVPPGKGLTLRVETRDGRLLSYPLPPFPETAEAGRIRRRLNLPPAIPLAGRVVDQSHGRPIPGALVWSADDPAAFQVTDTSGSYRLPAGVANAWFVLGAVAEGHLVSEEAFLPQGDRLTPPTLVLWPSGFLVGVVVDEDGNPVAQAELRVYLAGSDHEAARVRTSRQGIFHVAGVVADWYDLEVRRPGFLPLRVPGVDLRPDSAEDLEPLVLTRGKRLEGRVVEPDGASIEGAEVWVVPSQFARTRVWKTFLEAGPAAVTDQDGSFVLEGLDPRKTVHLEVCRPGHLTDWVSVKTSEAGPVQVELPRAARLSGRVVDPAGKPVSGAAVHASLSGAPRGDYNPPSSPCPQSARFVSAKSDAEGRFTLEPLEEGLFEIGVWSEGYRETAPQLIDIMAGQESAGLTFVLTHAEEAEETAPVAMTAPANHTAEDDGLKPRPDEPVVLSGRIVGIAPEDLPDVDIIASRPDQYLKFHSGFVDRYGIYRILSLAPGEWEVIAVNLNDGRGTEAKIVIAPGDEKAVLDLVFSEEPE